MNSGFSVKVPAGKGFLFFVLLGFSLTAFAQDDLLITVAAPAAETGTVSSSAIVPPTVSAVPDKGSAEQKEQELLRDPFWPVGFFPEGWQKKSSAQSEPNMDVSGWKAAAGKIRISGTSRMGGRTAALVNGELKSTGDLVDVLSEGKNYQWQIVGIEADGRVKLKKLGIK